jgi:hypothetical protein
VLDFEDTLGQGLLGVVVADLDGNGNALVF